MKCKACTHPKRTEINAEILKGVSDRQLASLYPGVARASFQRHRKHVSAELKRSRESQLAGDKTARGPLAGSPGPVGSPVGSIVPPPCYGAHLGC
jgi:hypothetical protein